MRNSTISLALGILLAGLACRRSAPPAPAAAADSVGPAGVAESAAVDLFASATVSGQPPPGAPPLSEAVAAIQREARRPQLGDLAALSTPQSVDRLALRTGSDAGPGRLPMTAGTVLSRFAGKILQVDYNGGRCAVVAAAPGMSQTSWFYLRAGHWLLDLADTRPLAPPWPGPADPANRPVTLAEAWTPSGQGPLIATLQTTHGTANCLLYEAEVPDLVANFVGLATGARASRRTEGRTLTTEWQHKPFYDGTVLYRAQPGRLVEGGDPFGLGTGQPGYRIADHLDLRLRHDRPGVLGMTPLGPNSAGSLFYIALQARPELDDRGLPFGLCRELEVLDRWSRLPAGSVKVEHVTIARGWPVSLPKPATPSSKPLAPATAP